MKESRLNYKGTKTRTKFKQDFDIDKIQFGKAKPSRKNKEVRDVERAIRSKDFRALMEDN